MWNDRFTRPHKPDTYAVKFFTGVESTAYWTGSTWVRNATCKTTNRMRGDRHLLKLLRGWKPLNPETLEEALESTFEGKGA